MSLHNRNTKDNLLSAYLVLPRMSGKRLLMTRLAIQKAKEGNSVYIADIGGNDKVLEPLENGNVLVRHVRRDDHVKSD